MFRRIAILFLIVTTVSVPLAGLSIAVQPVSAQAVTQSYGTDAPLQRGMVVKVADRDKNKVEPLNQPLATKMEGVVVAANDAPVSLSDPDSGAQQVYVARTGKYSMLVSTQNGVIKPNDYLVVSSLSGVVMKADSRQSTVVGRALSGFDGKSAISGTAALKDSTGKTITVSIGLAAADINVSRNPLQKTLGSKLPGVAFLQSGADTITGKAVDPARLYISLVVLVAVAAVAGSIIYGGIRSGIVSIGRNPLARQTITRSLVQVILTGIIIFIIGLFGIYLILKL